MKLAHWSSVNCWSLLTSDFPKESLYCGLTKSNKLYGVSKYWLSLFDVLSCLLPTMEKPALDNSMQKFDPSNVVKFKWTNWLLFGNFSDILMSVTWCFTSSIMTWASSFHCSGFVTSWFASSFILALLAYTSTRLYLSTRAMYYYITQFGGVTTLSFRQCFTLK